MGAILPGYASIPLTITRDRALALRALTPDPADLAEHLGVTVVFARGPARFVEMYLPGVQIAVVNVQLSPAARRWYLAHALAHHLLHAGDQEFLIAHCFGVVPRQEAQAERFAAFFLAPKLTDIYRLPLVKRAYRLQLARVCGEVA